MNETTVAIVTLGCKANQYDASWLEARLRERRFRLVDFKQSADVYIINTCTVTDRADQDSRNLIRRARRRNPEAFLIVTGCYAQTKPGEVAGIDGVDLVLGNAEKSRLLDHLEKGRPDRTRIDVEDVFRQRELETFGTASYSRNTRAFLKIQDGCNQFCSFCIIPYARGRNRSVPIPRVLEELHRLREAGFHEAVLTGIHIGTYGRDLPEAATLTELLQAIDRERPIHRVRISSIDPEEVSDELGEYVSGSSAFCPHLHVPLQSGDDATLKMMRRRYDREKFREVCENLANRNPRLCLGTDVIVGFPYEDEARFQNTFKLLSETPVHYFHVFPFSPKRDTPAAKMLDQVPQGEKKERASRLRMLSGEKTRAYRRRFLGGEAEVILEEAAAPCQNSETGEGYWSGVSENYLPMIVRAARNRAGDLVRCRITSESGGALGGEALEG
jgi:threonylcarbamoyladenosine tRNA methylthiotransferase MtaB